MSQFNWHRLDFCTPMSDDTFLIRQDKLDFYWGRVVNEVICTCRDYKNLNSMTVDSVREHAMPIEKFLKLHEAMGRDIEWAYFEPDRGEIT